MSVRISGLQAIGRQSGVFPSNTGMSAVYFAVLRNAASSFHSTLEMLAAGSTNGFLVTTDGTANVILSSNNGDIPFSPGFSFVVDEWVAFAVSINGSQQITLRARRIGDADWSAENVNLTTLNNGAFASITMGDSLEFAGASHDGDVAGAKFWDAELSSEELLRETFQITPQRYADLNSFYPLFGDDADRFRDYGPGGYNFGEVYAGFTNAPQPPIRWGGPVHIIQPQGAVVRSITAAHSIAVPTMDAPAKLIGKATAAQSVPVPTMAAAVTDVIAPTVISGGVSTDSQGIGSSQTTGSISPLAGSNRVALILSAYESDNDRNASSVVWSGQAATLVDSVELNSGGIRKIFVHRILEADYPSSPGAVTTTYDGAVDNDGLIAVVQIQDASQTATIGAVAKATTGGVSLQINPVSVDNALTLCVGIGDNTDPLTVSGGSEIANFGNVNDLLMGITADYSDSSSTITTTFGVDSSDQILAVGFAVAPFQEADRTVAAAQAIPVPTMAATVDVVVKATAAQSIPVPSMAAAADVVVKASAAQSVAVPTMDAAAKLIAKAAAAQSIPVPTMDASLATQAGIVAAHSIPVPTQSASVGVIAKASAAQSIPVPTMSAEVAPIAKAAASQSIGVPTMSAAAKVVIKTSASHSIAVPSQSAAIRADSGIVAVHSIPVPTMDAAARVIVKATAPQSIAVPSQTAAVSVVAKAAAAQSIAVPSMSASAKLIAKAAAAHSIPVPTMDASLIRNALGFVADHSIPVPTMDATAKAIVKATGVNAFQVPTMSATATVRIEVAAAQSIPVPTMSAFVAVGEREVFALTGSIAGPVSLAGKLPVISLTGSVTD